MQDGFKNKKEELEFMLAHLEWERSKIDKEIKKIRKQLIKENNK